MSVIDDIRAFYEEHPRLTIAVGVGVFALAAGAVILSRRDRAEEESEQVQTYGQQTPLYPVSRLMDAYPPTVIQAGSQVITIRPPQSQGNPPRVVAPNLRRFEGVSGIACPRGSKLQQRADGSWTCVSDRTGKEIPIRERTESGWRPVA